MDTNRLYDILQEATAEFRVGPERIETEGDGVKKVEIFDMPHIYQASSELEKVECHFITIGVNREKAEEHREELISILKTYPNPERLAGGPSYIEMGAEIGSQDLAFRLFAVGQVLKFWMVITPKTLGIEGAQADELAGGGLVMISGFREPKAIDKEKEEGKK